MMMIMSHSMSMLMVMSHSIMMAMSYWYVCFMSEHFLVLKMIPIVLHLFYFSLLVLLSLFFFIIEFFKLSMCIIKLNPLILYLNCIHNYWTLIWISPPSLHCFKPIFCLISNHDDCNELNDCFIRHLCLSWRFSCCFNTILHLHFFFILHLFVGVWFYS